VKISCPACAAKYSIADEKVQDRLAKIRCRKCGTTIVIDGKVSPANVYAADGAGHSDGHEVTDGDAHAGGAGEYTVDFGENDQRSMSLSDLIAAYNSGQVTGETFVWADGFADWTALAEVPQIVEALNSGTKAPARAAAPAAFSAPAFSPEPARAAVASTARRGGDLFGGIDVAGSEEDVATSAPQDAHAASPAAVTGARNESSVLFSLSALTSSSTKTSKPTQAAPMAAMSPMAAISSASADDDDSGLIDLKALSSAAAAPAGDLLAAPLMPSPLGAPPLGMAAPMSIDSSMDMSMPQPKSKMGLIAAMVFAIAAVIIAAMVIFKPAPPPPEQPQAAQPLPLPTRPREEPTAENTAKPPATGTAAEDAGGPKTAAKAGAKYRGGKRTPKGGSGTTEKPSGGGEAAPAPAKKPAGGGCGCAPGDLPCAIRCASK
jgi:predicted Zn finger-like uncharacterized protein